MPNRSVRLSHPTLKVLRLLVDNPRNHPSGAEISRETGVGSGTLYPMLGRLEEAGWLASEWESIDPTEAGRPRKRFYWLTAAGSMNAQAALDEVGLPSGRLAWT